MITDRGGGVRVRPRVVLATRNAHKVEELARILREEGVDVELTSVADLPGAPEVAETEASFAGNALLKARALAAFTGLPAVADDSGLCVDALNGMPGIFSARWSGGAGDAANLELLLAQLRDVPPWRRGAHFICAAAVAMPDGRTAVVEGRVDGTVIDAPRGSNGFGYDPVFVPLVDPAAPPVTPAAVPGIEGAPMPTGRTTAEMADAEKDSISHRGKALRALAPVLNAMLHATR